jgi:hypothetical protein
MYQPINILDYDSKIVETFAIEELKTFLDYDEELLKDALIVMMH